MMNLYTRNEDKRFVSRYGWFVLLVIYVLSIPHHFIYEWLGENAVVGIFAPINESIWEHLKLVFWPLLLLWAIGYLFFKDKKDLDLTKWMTAGTSSILFCMTFIVGWYYSWVYGLTTESSIIDIGSLYIGVLFGQLIAIHVYKVVKPRSIYFILSILFLVLFAGLFIWFTFSPPNLPLFIPPN